MTPTQIKTVREKLGLTQSEFANIVRSDARTVRRWEADPTLATSRAAPGPVLAILDALRRGVRAHYFKNVKS